MRTALAVGFGAFALRHVPGDSAKRVPIVDKRIPAAYP